MGNVGFRFHVGLTNPQPLSFLTNFFLCINIISQTNYHNPESESILLLSGFFIFVGGFCVEETSKAMGSLGVLRNTTMVCVPLMRHSVEQMVGDMYQAKIEGADLVELRLDCLKEFNPQRDLQTLLRNKPLPVAVVYRYV